MNFPVAVISTCIPTLQARGDQLVVNNNATGNFKIFVQDTGVSPQSDDAMTLVKTGEGMLRLRWAIPAVSLILGPMSMS